jgi:cytochrome c oxidase subunit 1
MLSGALTIMLFGYVFFNFREFTGLRYSWLLAFLQFYYHFIGHVFTFVPLLWLGYCGMPRRIQDYPWSYASWHSVASFGHVIVLIGIFFFFVNVSISLYLKKVASSKNKGFPFISSKFSYLLINKFYIACARFSKQSLGLLWIRKYFALRKIHCVI